MHVACFPVQQQSLGRHCRPAQPVRFRQAFSVSLRSPTWNPVSLLTACSIVHWPSTTTTDQTSVLCISLTVTQKAASKTCRSTWTQLWRWCAVGRARRCVNMVKRCANERHHSLCFFCDVSTNLSVTSHPPGLFRATVELVWQSVGSDGGNHI